jgi:antitoxin HicB
LIGLLKGIVTKERIAFQLSQAMKMKRITKMKLAELMDTSRTQSDRILDPASGNVTIETLQRVAGIVGRELRVGLLGTHSNVHPRSVDRTTKAISQVRANPQSNQLRFVSNDC